MSFNENQLFYAALWWTAGLPGGPEHAPSILARYGKEPVTFPPCEFKRGKKETSIFSVFAAASLEEMREMLEQMDAPNPAEAILPPEKLDAFFDHLYAALSDPKLKYDSAGKYRYIDISQSFATSSSDPAYPDFPFSDEIEAAIAAAGIHRHALPQKMHLFAHDDGQLFIPQKAGDSYTLVPFDYPGRPALPYQYTVLRPEDMDHCPVLAWETLYRVVPLRPGQKYKSGYIAVSGQRIEHEREAREGEVLLVGNNDVDDIKLLWTLTDEEIINFHPSMQGSFADDAEEHKDGYRNERSGSYVEKTDTPNIVSEKLPGISYMVVKQPTQLSYGSSFAVAWPGDFIIREGKGYSPRVMPKDLIDSGRVRFIFPEAPGGQVPQPKFN